MPTVRKVLIFKFAELSDAAKEKAREWYRSLIFTDSGDWDTVYEDAETIAELMGLEISQRTYKTVGGGTGTEPAIYFSGFSSQGDGASFEGRYRYKADAMEAVKDHAPVDEKLHRIVARLQNAQSHTGKIGFKITTRGNYSHSGMMQFELLDTDADGEEIDVESINAEDEKEAIQALRDFADWIYRQLEAEHDWQSSDEQVDESIEANEYDFLENGERA